MQSKKRGLGKGLDSLLSSSTVTRNKQVSHDIHAEKTQQLVVSEQGELQDLDVNLLQVGKYQPRKDMSSEALQELANSIHAQGIIQPVVVRETGHQNYEIIAGERRWRAAKMVGLELIPCLVKNVEDDAAIAIALIENIQRENLNAMEEAIALKRIVDEFELTHQEVAKAVGKSRTAVSNLLRLNNLNPDVQILLEHGDIEMGHARALLACEGQLQSELAQVVVSKELTVRDTERLVKRAHEPEKNKPTPIICEKTESLVAVLENKFGFKVSAKNTSKGGGKLVIDYNSSNELDTFITLLENK